MSFQMIKINQYLSTNQNAPFKNALTYCVGSRAVAITDAILTSYGTYCVRTWLVPPPLPLTITFIGLKLTSKAKSCEQFPSKSL